MSFGFKCVNLAWRGIVKKEILNWTHLSMASSVKNLEVIVELSASQKKKIYSGYKHITYITLCFTETMGESTKQFLLFKR